MALVECPECGKSVSSTINACIHCGFALREPANMGAPAESTTTSYKRQTATENKSALKAIDQSAYPIVKFFMFRPIYLLSLISLAALAVSFMAWTSPMLQASCGGLYDLGNLANSITSTTGLGGNQAQYSHFLGYVCLPDYSGTFLQIIQNSTNATFGHLRLPVAPLFVGLFCQLLGLAGLVLSFFGARRLFRQYKANENKGFAQRIKLFIKAEPKAIVIFGLVGLCSLFLLAWAYPLIGPRCTVLIPYNPKSGPLAGLVNVNDYYQSYFGYTCLPFDTSILTPGTTYILGWIPGIALTTLFALGIALSVVALLRRYKIVNNPKQAKLDARKLKSTEANSTRPRELLKLRTGRLFHGRRRLYMISGIVLVTISVAAFVDLAIANSKHNLSADQVERFYRAIGDGGKWSELSDKNAPIQVEIGAKNFQVMYSPAFDLGAHIFLNSTSNILDNHSSTFFVYGSGMDRATSSEKLLPLLKLDFPGSDILSCSNIISVLPKNFESSSVSKALVNELCSHNGGDDEPKVFVPQPWLGVWEPGTNQIDMLTMGIYGASEGSYSVILDSFSQEPSNDPAGGPYISKRYLLNAVRNNQGFSITWPDGHVTNATYVDSDAYGYQHIFLDCGAYETAKIPAASFFGCDFKYHDKQYGDSYSNAGILGQQLTAAPGSMNQKYLPLGLSSEYLGNSKNGRPEYKFTLHDRDGNPFASVLTEDFGEGLLNSINPSQEPNSIGYELDFDAKGNPILDVTLDCSIILNLPKDLNCGDSILFQTNPS